ncbi:histidine phosphatase family protein [Bacillus sp. FJAT-49711]|uniref:histidine phosphatase family protein n=1 Tax=Bacillus sp. FJAT-49711 TaxID=2833585 RepID=UPI001BCA2DB4|nr:histidine phosphatase family protein [Bacillus sp. FJAT-49711]MBS4218818.1 histidine phosphatase family protein [Bacillus sp. FJAT-49711]
MELVFIRHGQGEHTLEIPRSLQLEDPSLTAKGVEQARLLRSELPLEKEDIIIISPTRRTLETALIWSENIRCQKIVSVLVSPRMFPILPDARTLPCDKIMDIEHIKSEFPSVHIDMAVPPELWSKGINIMAESEFVKISKEFIADYKGFKKEKLHIVSHDGTITSYRQMISGQTLTRKDFPQDAGWYRINC